MTKSLLLAVGVMLLALGYMLGQSHEPARVTNPGASAGGLWNAEAGAFVSEANGTLRLWKMHDGKVVEVVEYSTSFVQEAGAVSKEPAVFRRILKPAPEGAERAKPATPVYEAPPVPTSCGGGSCG